MDDFIFWVIIFMLIVVLSQSRRTIPKTYPKKYTLYFTEIFIATGIIFALFSAACIFYLFDSAFWGGLLLIIGILFIIGYAKRYKKISKEMSKMYIEQQRNSLYEEELIKERARLQAQKEHRRK